MINKVILMGRLTADPELRQTASGIASCRFTVAVDRAYKPKDGEKQTDFLSVVAWRQTAEFVSRYFSKGRMIIVEGELQNNNYEKDGVKHYSYVVSAQSVTFGESKASAENASQCVQTAAQAAQPTAQTQTAEATDEPVSLGDLGDFEEILSDGEVPF